MEAGMLDSQPQVCMATSGSTFADVIQSYIAELPKTPFGLFLLYLSKAKSLVNIFVI